MVLYKALHVLQRRCKLYRSLSSNLGCFTYLVICGRHVAVSLVSERLNSFYSCLCRVSHRLSSKLCIVVHGSLTLVLSRRKTHADTRFAKRFMLGSL